MKRFKFYAIFIAMVTLVACSDDFVPELTTNLETNSYEFSSEGGEQTFLLESNEQWSVGEVPDWITVAVTDAPDTRATSASYDSGRKSVTIAVKPNPNHEKRTALLKMESISGGLVQLTIVQAKKPELVYWILSEGEFGSNSSEIAWFDVATGKVASKQFKALNDTELGGAANDLQIYGSKMYVLVNGPGYGAETQEGASYIEVINPISGESIERIPFVDADGVAAKPRKIIFEGGKGYISSYSNEVVRLDTALLAFDGHATLSGTLAEGLTYNDGKIYVCNSGQGQDDKISVVDVESMKETKVIATAMNPTGIVSVSSGVLYFNTNYPAYTLYKLTTDDEVITEIPGVNVAEMTYLNNNLYTSLFDWDTSVGEMNQVNTTTDEVTSINLDFESVGISSIVDYHIGAINDTDLLYLTGMNSDDVVIFNSITKEIVHALKTGVAGGIRVVGVYN